MTNPTTDVRPAIGTDESDVLLRARGITKRFGDRDVLKAVDIDVHRGEFVAVMGPSGSGKSSLLYAVSGLDRPDAGTVDFEGRDLVGLKESALAELRLERVGFVFQQVHLLRNLSLIDNVLLPGFQAATAPRPQVVSRAQDLMRRAGVGDLADRDLTQASGGQLQRVGICRALINEPALIFADEPTGALDSESTEQVLELLAGVRDDGAALMVVTHDALVAAHADRVVAMVDGVVAGDLALGSIGDDEVTERQLLVENWLRETTTS